MALFCNSDSDSDYCIEEDTENETDDVFYVNENIPLDEKIIKEIKKYVIVEFGRSFNQPVDNLPDFNPEKGVKGLQSLTFGDEFNQSVDNLPLKIQKLIFNWNFNQPVDNLPPSQ